MNQLKVFFSLLIILVFIIIPFDAEAQKDSTHNVIYLNKSEFLQKIYNYEQNRGFWKYEGDKPCIVDFYASWCMPCRKLSPILEQVAEQFKDSIIIYKIDIDKDKELAADFGISSIPVLWFIPLDAQPQLARGLLPKEIIIQAVNELLLNKQNNAEKP